MPNFKRYYIPNAIIFITTVTRNRYPYLQSKKDINLFFETIRKVREFHPFKLFAYVILPDHFHWLMKVGDPAGDFSKVMQSIKRNFTLNYKKAHKLQTPISIWQRRFWDHVIRDEKDLERHFDYIHWNPIKHSYVQRPEEWPNSTYQYWLERDFYESGWGGSKEPDNIIGIDIE